MDVLSKIRAKIDDPARLAALYETVMLDTLGEPAFDNLTKLAARLLGAPLVVDDVEAPDTRGHRGNEFILLVEDETVVRKAMARMLRRSGCFVLEAANGEDALTLLKHGGDSIDLMITDLVMPQMSGGDLAHRVRATRPGLPMMFVSGHTEEGSSHRAFLTASDSFLEKPFLVEQLTAKVREALAPV